MYLLSAVFDKFARPTGATTFHRSVEASLRLAVKMVKWLDKTFAESALQKAFNDSSFKVSDFLNYANKCE